MMYHRISILLWRVQICYHWCIFPSTGSLSLHPPLFHPVCCWLPAFCFNVTLQFKPELKPWWNSVLVSILKLFVIVLFYHQPHHHADVLYFFYLVGMDLSRCVFMSDGDIAKLMIHSRFVLFVTWHSKTSEPRHTSFHVWITERGWHSSTLIVEHKWDVLIIWRNQSQKVKCVWISQWSLMTRNCGSLLLPYMVDSQNLKFSSSCISKMEIKVTGDIHINKMPPISTQFIK